MAPDQRRLRIFISSPGDVLPARELTTQIIEKIAPDYARYFIVRPYLWEYEPMIASGHFEDSIDPPSRFDVVIIILESRLGTPLPERTAKREYRGIDGRVPVTGTEWEFEDALAEARTHGLPRLLVYRSKRNAEISTRDAQSRRVVIEQLEALEAFWSRHFGGRTEFIGAFSDYDGLDDFAKRLERDLRSCIEQRVDALPAAERERPVQLWFRDPFRGLESYEFEHAPIFFGRDEVLGTALSRLVTNAQAGRPFLLVLGASGSGKSSLVKAGVVPRLLLPHRVSETAFLRRVVFRAGDVRNAEDLFDALVRCLTTASGDDVGLPELLGPSMSPQEFAVHLRQSVGHPDYPFARALDDLAAKARKAGRTLPAERARLVLVIDQLEEVFTAQRVQADERKRFIQLLAALVRSELLWVIATMRADFWHRAAETPELIELADGRGRLDLLPPSPAELSQMISAPARASQIAFERPESTGIPLNDRIAEEAAGEPGALPLLSYLLDQLYLKDVKQGGAGTLTYATYDALGGLNGAIATRADTVVASLPKEVQTALPQVLFALIQAVPGGGQRPVARRAPLAEFPVGSAKRRLVDALLDPAFRLVVADGDGDSAIVRVAHEALISEWQKARTYLEDNADLLRIRERIEDRYERWRALESSSRGGETARHGPQGLTTATARAQFAAEQGLLADLDLADAQRLLNIHRDGLAPELIAYIDRSVDRDRRRRQRAVRVVSTVAVGLFVLVLLTAISWVRELTARRAAERELLTANATAQFLVDLFDKSNPDKNPDASTTVRHMLDLGAQAIRTEPALRSQPEVRARLLTTMGEAYLALGLYPAAEEQLTQAQAAESSTRIPDQLRVHTLVALGTLRFLMNDDQPAANFLGEAVDLAKALPASDPFRSAALTGLADVWVDQGRYAEAEQLCHEALDADRRRASGPESASIRANTLDSLGGAYFYAGDLIDAVGPWREALNLREQTLGDADPNTAASYNNYAGLLYELGRYSEALSQYQRALPVFTTVYGAQHPRVATVLNNIARSALMLGKIDTAKQFADQSLAMTSKLQGATNEEMVPPLMTLAAIAAYRGQLDEASKKIMQADQIAHLPDHGQFLDQVLLVEAYIELARGDPGQAARLLAESHKQLKPETPQNAWLYAVWNVVNAGVLVANGDRDSATRALNTARPIILQRFGTAGFYTLLLRQRESQLVGPLKP